jgi:hypothetical protein
MLARVRAYVQDVWRGIMRVEVSGISERALF